MARKGEARVRCAECGGDIRWSVVRMGWTHVVSANNDHTARHPQEK